MVYTTIKSPLGPLLLAANDLGLCLISFAASDRATVPQAGWIQDESPFTETTRQLRAYFGGELREFDVRLCLEGTDFQMLVWKNLSTIPFGQMLSYGQLAHRIGQPKAARAVGLANGSNPIPIIVPCHRVIGTSGKLTGYGGGLDIKQKLLRLESRQMCLV